MLAQIKLLPQGGGGLCCILSCCRHTVVPFPRIFHCCLHIEVPSPSHPSSLSNPILSNTFISKGLKPAPIYLITRSHLFSDNEVDRQFLRSS